MLFYGDEKYVAAIETLHGRLQLAENRRSESQKHFFGAVISPPSTHRLHELASNVDEVE